MTNGQHERLRRIFELCLGAPPAERGALLDRECSGDTELRSRIEAMLVAAEDDRFLAAPTGHGAAPSSHDFQPTLDAPSSGVRPDDPTVLLHERQLSSSRIGPYKILQQIGEGGFGSVYMAEQEKPVQRKVALKVIKLGMDTRQVVARFEQERQALAMMDHPTLARVFDAGATETGRPYFAMELVKGDPIISYCDTNNLSIQDRLVLFEQVCNAVQHAHTKGIIHRDIKPSNILVSTQDGRPNVKVIDFGIAKATASKLTEKTLFTEHKQLIGTPEYMSPEQAEGSLDIDTRTDVYSLGVVLYELLTGSTPFAGRDLRSAAFAEIQRMIREVDPPRPSTRLSQSADTLASIAAQRKIEPRRLGTIIRGELDWIVMRALEKDRQRRYETASGLASDIRRYLDGDDVLAAPPSTAYRIRKLVRRNKGKVLAGGVVALALALGIVGTSVGMVNASREREEAVKARAGEMEQRRMAETRLAEAEATVRFLDDMLGAADPMASGKDVTVRQVLDQAARTIGPQFADRPAVAARLHGTIGRTYLGLGTYDEAESHARESLAILTREKGAGDPDTCRATNALGMTLIKGGSHDEAERLLKQAIIDHERLFGRGNEVTVQSIDILAVLYGLQLRTDEAIPLLREVLELRTVSPGPEHLDTVSSMNTLGVACADASNFEEAEKLLTTAMEIQDRVGGRDHPLSLEIRSNLAWALYFVAMEQQHTHPDLHRPRLERSMALGEEALAGRIRVLGE
ncbi:MAG: serine/threonine protein kinase, partial [Phycisphaerales bacterium]|nr:serine/threonine protein kinase [Phycisphaerales bacterium]